MEFKEEAPIAVKDPVCGREIEPATAYSKTEYDNEMFYFCSKHCSEEFNKNPKKYTSKKNEHKH